MSQVSRLRQGSSKVLTGPAKRERRLLEDERRRLEDERRRLEDERNRLVDERLRLQDAEQRAETGRTVSADVAELGKIKRLGDEWKRHDRRNDRINTHIKGHLKRADIDSGRTLEIGAREHPRRDVFGISNWDYCILDIEEFESDDSTIEYVIADITDCANIPDNSFDVVVSVDVFEHVDRPWLAAEEISRILKPRGLSYTSTLFAWRYHPVPIDFWRFTPDCLEFLFSGLDTVECAFDTVERRRDVRGRGNRDRVPIDALGGFRENWRVFHVGQKPMERRSK